MLSWFFNKPLNLTTDIHSHLLPGLDDGVKTFEEALSILSFFEKMGYKKVITTPHIHHGVYPNTESSIAEKLELLQQRIAESDLTIHVEAAAEYFIDEFFLKKIESGTKLCEWGDRYVLVETSFFNKPILFDQVIFSLKSNGYQPVLAHPERYQFESANIEWFRTLVDSGVNLQVNLPSLVGAYGKLPQQMAGQLMRESLVSFMGSDVHRVQQLPVLSKALKKKVPRIGLMNQTI